MGQGGRGQRKRLGHPRRSGSFGRRAAIGHTVVSAGIAPAILEDFAVTAWAGTRYCTSRSCCLALVAVHSGCSAGDSEASGEISLVSSVGDRVFRRRTKFLHRASLAARGRTFGDNRSCQTGSGTSWVIGGSRSFRVARRLRWEHICDAAGGKYSRRAGLDGGRGRTGDGRGNRWAARGKPP